MDPVYAHLVIDPIAACRQLPHLPTVRHLSSTRAAAEQELYDARVLEVMGPYDDARRQLTDQFLASVEEGRANTLRLLAAADPLKLEREPDFSAFVEAHGAFFATYHALRRHIRRSDILSVFELLGQPTAHQQVGNALQHLAAISVHAVDAYHEVREFPALEQRLRTALDTIDQLVQVAKEGIVSEYGIGDAL